MTNPVDDLKARHGEMIPLRDLAEYFGAAQRAVRRALEDRQIPILTFGSATVVPLRQVEEAFGLDPAHSQTYEGHDAERWRAAHRPDGTRRREGEYIDEVASEMPALRDEIEAARKSLKKPTEKVAVPIARSTSARAYDRKR